MNHVRVGGVLLVAFCLVGGPLAPACVAGDSAPIAKPGYGEMVDLQAQTMRLVNRAFRPPDMRFARGRILWLSGDPVVWNFGAMRRALRWAARGNVVWIDTNLSCAIGPHHSVGGSVESAYAAPGSAQHPLMAGVQRVYARDTFCYIRGLPTGAQALMTEWNRDDHVVLAVWPLDTGVVILRPPTRPDSSRPHPLEHEHWLDIHRGDGLRLAYNICLFSLGALGKEPGAGTP